ncbi:MAG TPA: ABC transporter substrate-binding protein [Steroidobacteraceae bacterium]|nr:ABC transporter substrate-binding protein [Steroidobacteraceae bacterium]
MKRREFMILVGVAAAWPVAARAQQPDGMRRIGVLMLYPENDPEGQLRATGFRQGLQKLGWAVGRNVEIDFQWGLGDADWIRSAGAQLLRLAPDVILANGTPAARTMQQLSRTVPIIFIAGNDPVVDGLAMSLAHPGGNLTGLYVFEPSFGGKMLELLKEIAPHIARVAILVNPDANSATWYAAAAAAAPRFAVEVVEAPLRDSNEIEAAMAEWGREQNYGLIVLPDPATNAHRKLINELAAHYRLPTIHFLRSTTRDGALMSYGADLPDVFRQAAAFADQILKGAKPADLPVQLPTKLELAINLKTAKALGLTVPNTLLVSADEVFE